MIIFSQGPTKHSRIGNSFVWMCKFKFLLDELGVEFCFPWAVENFGFYFDESSIWMKKNYPNDFFKAKFNLEISAKSISSISRKIEHQHELRHGLKAFKWKNLVITDPEFKLLYLAGKIDITDSKILELIRKHENTIIHEPFNFSFSDPNLKLIDLTSIAPKKSLYESQSKYVNQISGDKRKVGLHIRRGDYKGWLGGKYYYDDDYWIDKVKLLTNDETTVFIFTNEENPIFTKKLLDQGAFLSIESFEIDFVRMLFMNEIYGPPSTFSRMAVNLAKNTYGLDSAFHYLEPLH
jgi:hypothetical protein